jgi:catalase
MEQAHIIRAFRFELTRVQTAAIRERVVSQLRNVNEGLASAVAEGLGMELPDPQPRVLSKPPRAEVTKSSPLSLFARPGDGSIRTRRIAIIVAPGMSGASVKKLQAALTALGAVPRLVGAKLGSIETTEGESLEVDVTLEAAPAVLFDALVIPDIETAEGVGARGLALEFVKDQYRHCKAILAIGAGALLLDEAGISANLASGKPDPGVLTVEASGDKMDAFVAAIARHRHFERQTDPPRI